MTTMPVMLTTEAAAVAMAEAVERTRAEGESKIAAVREEARFLSSLVGMSSSGSQSSPLSPDVARRGAPAPVEAEEDAVAVGMPVLDDVEVRAAWGEYIRGHAPAHVAEGKARGEVNSVQPVILRVAMCAAGADAAGAGAGAGAAGGGVVGDLRVWVGKVAADDCKLVEAIPDQMWTHARDSVPSMIGALVLVEVKKPGADSIGTAVSQATNYQRRHVAALYHEAHARGTTGHDIVSFAVATDGASLVLLRMVSGAPADGDVTGAVPCRVLATAPLPLLAGL